MKAPRTHMLSFDVEEHFQVSAFWTEERRREWDKLESRVVRNTHRILNVLGQHSTQATFFILGWVAERHPGLVKDLVNGGHEVASHGYGHELVSDLTPEQFREDVRKAKAILEDAAGRPVCGYRAPSFSISSKTPWALPILVEEGYRYDSSVYNRFKGSSDDAALQRGAVEVQTSAGPLIEVSPSTLTALGLQLPVAGGGYFRLLPYWVSRLFLKRLEKQGVPLVMYLHPWELDPEQPRMQGSMISTVRHYLNLRKTEQRLAWLLDEFSFAPIQDAMGRIVGTHAMAIRGQREVAATP